MSRTLGLSDRSSCEFMDISVVIPTYNRIEKLRHCLESVRDQDFKGEYEVIVVEDDVSQSSRVVVTDVGKLSKKATFRYFSQDHKGPAAARNFGVKEAKADIIAFTDDDCVVPKNWLTSLTLGFEQYKSAGGVGGFMEAPDDELKTNPYARYESYVTHKVYGAGAKEVLGGFEVPTGGTNNIAFKKSVIQEVGGFDETFPVAAGEDADLKLRVVRAGYKILYVPIKVEHYHVLGWKSFVRQSWLRGIGSHYFHKKHGGGLGMFALVGMLMLLPAIFVKDLLKKVPVGVAVLKWVASGVDFVSQLHYRLGVKSSRFKVQS